MARIEVKVTREVSREQLLGGPLRTFFNTAMLLAHSDVAKAGRVPWDTGNLAGSLSPGGGATEIDPSPVPMWARVGTNVEYAAYLETGDKYHYRGGPSSGKETRGWLSSTIQNVRPDIDGLLGDLAADIKAAWEG